MNTGFVNSFSNFIEAGDYPCPAEFINKNDSIIRVENLKSKGRLNKILEVNPLNQPVFLIKTQNNINIAINLLKRVSKHLEKLIFIYIDNLLSKEEQEILLISNKDELASIVNRIEFYFDDNDEGLQLILPDVFYDHNIDDPHYLDYQKIDNYFNLIDFDNLNEQDLHEILNNIINLNNEFDFTDLKVDDVLKNKITKEIKKFNNNEEVRKLINIFSRFGYINYIQYEDFYPCLYVSIESVSEFINAHSKDIENKKVKFKDLAKRYVDEYEGFYESFRDFIDFFTFHFTYLRYDEFLYNNIQLVVDFIDKLGEIVVSCGARKV
jgi:hypothetical protein